MKALLFFFLLFTSDTSGSSIRSSIIWLWLLLLYYDSLKFSFLTLIVKVLLGITLSFSIGFIFSELAMLSLIDFISRIDSSIGSSFLSSISYLYWRLFIVLLSYFYITYFCNYYCPFLIYYELNSLVFRGDDKHFFFFDGIRSITSSSSLSMFFMNFLLFM